MKFCRSTREAWPSMGEWRERVIQDLLSRLWRRRRTFSIMETETYSMWLLAMPFIWRSRKHSSMAQTDGCGGGNGLSRPQRRVRATTQMGTLSRDDRNSRKEN